MELVTISMLAQAFFILFLLPLQVISTPYRSQSVLGLEDDGCPTGAHIVGVRGTMELPGFGVMGPLVQQLLDLIPGSDNYSLIYPAQGLFNHTPWYNFKLYKESEQVGVDNLNGHIMDFTENCPNTKIILMGYSQVRQLDLESSKSCKY